MLGIICKLEGTLPGPALDHEPRPCRAGRRRGAAPHAEPARGAQRDVAGDGARAAPGAGRGRSRRPHAGHRAARRRRSFLRRRRPAATWPPRARNWPTTRARWSRSTPPSASSAWPSPTPAWPTVAVLEGSVMGGGFGLACVADVAMAGTSALFRLPETSLGVVPAQIAPFLVERLGYSEAKRLAVTGGRLDASAALDLRLVHAVHAAGALDSALDARGRRDPAMRTGRGRRHQGADREGAPARAGVAGAGGGRGLLARRARPRGHRRHDGVPAEAQGDLGAAVTFRKILVANRGEIACRVMRTARAARLPHGGRVQRRRRAGAARATGRRGGAHRRRRRPPSRT